MIKIFVPGKPVAKGRPRVSTFGGAARMYTPAKTAAYEGLVALAGAEVMAGRDLLDGALHLAVTARFALPQKVSRARLATAALGRDWHTGRPDADNILKAIGDGLNGVVWTDDSRIAHASIVKVYAETPGVLIEVSEIGE